MKPKQRKRERFERVAAYRVQRILKFLDSLANCANKGNYEYEDSDVKKMFGTIKTKLKESEMAFDKELNKNGKNTFTF
jgi:hypothetical protein